MANHPLNKTLGQVADKNLMTYRQRSMRQRASLLHLLGDRLLSHIIPCFKQGAGLNDSPKVPFNLNYSMVPSRYAIKSEDQVTDLTFRPCRALLSIIFARS